MFFAYFKVVSLILVPSGETADVSVEMYAHLGTNKRTTTMMFEPFFHIVVHHNRKYLNCPYDGRMGWQSETAFMQGQTHLCGLQCSVGMRRVKILFFFSD